MTDVQSHDSFPNEVQDADKLSPKLPQNTPNPLDEQTFCSAHEEIALEFDDGERAHSNSDVGCCVSLESQDKQGSSGSDRWSDNSDRSQLPTQDGKDGSFKFSQKLHSQSLMPKNLSSSNFDSLTYGNKVTVQKVVNDYLMGEVVGEGAFGKVREAVHAETRRRVAMKILKKRNLRKIKGGEESIQNEIGIMTKLKKHRNIVELIEVIYDDANEKMYIVLEFVGGGSLQDMIDSIPDKDERLPVFQWKPYFRQLIEGLEYIHSQGIVHRDIKPGNLMITSDGTLKISDFGVAEEVEKFQNSDAATRCMGSPAFQPPQIAKGGDKFSGSKHDIWACGVTLFLLATGHLPFEGDTIYQLFENISRGKFEIPSDVDPGLTDLIRHMLDVNEKARYSIEQIKKHPWYSREEPVSFLTGSQGSSQSQQPLTPAEPSRSSSQQKRGFFANLFARRARSNLEGSMTNLQHVDIEESAPPKAPSSRRRFFGFCR